MRHHRFPPAVRGSWKICESLDLSINVLLLNYHRRDQVRRLSYFAGPVNKLITFRVHVSPSMASAFGWLAVSASLFVAGRTRGPGPARAPFDQARFPKRGPNSPS